MEVTAGSTRRRATTVWGVGAAAAAVGLGLAGAVDGPSGLDRLELEDVVDVVGILLVSAIGLPLAADARRSRLGLALAWVSAVLGVGMLLDGLGRAVHGGWPGLASGLLVLGSAVLPVVVVLVAVAVPVLAPDGAPLWRWSARAARAAVAGAALLAVTDVLQAGPVDEDAPALGANPIGVEALGSALDLARVAALLAVAVGVAAALSSLAVRLTRRGPATRRRTAWLAAGLGVLVLALALDGELQARGGGVYGVVAAAVALGGLAACIRLATRPVPAATSCPTEQVTGGAA